jgi:hypothetical protein
MEIRDTPLAGQPDGHAYRGPDRVYSSGLTEFPSPYYPDLRSAYLGKRRA